MSSNFLQQFMAGWQMGQQRLDSQRANQMMQMRQQEADRRAQQEAQEYEMRKEEFALRKKQLQAAEAENEFNAKARAAAMMSEQTQVAPPAVEDLGGGGPNDLVGKIALGPAERPTAPIMGTIPGTDQQVQLPFFEQILRQKQAEQQMKMQDALFLRQMTQKTPEEIYEEALARARGQREGNPPRDSQGPSGSFVEAVGPDGKPVLFNATTGEVRQYPTGVSPKERPIKVTPGERQTLAFYERASSSADTAMKLEERIAKSGTGGQAWMKYAPNFLQAPEGRAYNQAKKEFTEARLRKESGAAIPPSEFENDDKTYFIQPGDDAATVAQKQAARQRVIDGLKNSAGGAFAEKYGGAPAEASGIDPAVEAALKALGY